MKEQTAAEKIIKLFNMAEADRRFEVSHGAVAKAIKEKGRAGIGYAEALRDIDVHENIRDYILEHKKEVRDKIESKKEKK